MCCSPQGKFKSTGKIPMHIDRYDSKTHGRAVAKSNECVGSTVHGYYSPLCISVICLNLKKKGPMTDKTKKTTPPMET